MKRILLIVGVWMSACASQSINLRASAVPTALGRFLSGEIDPDHDRWTECRRVEVPDEGALIVNLRQSNPQAQLELRVYGDGTVPLTTGDSAKGARVDDVHHGSYWVAVIGKNSEATRFEESIVYKPADPEKGGGPERTQAGAREVAELDGARLAGTVDYSAMKRTQWWKLRRVAGGALSLRFAKDAPAGVTAEVFMPGVASEKVDPLAGWKRDVSPPGDYYVRVTANEAGDRGDYTLSVTYSLGDLCANGGEACRGEAPEELKVPSDNRTSEVDASKGNAFHWYKLQAPQKGKVLIAFRVLGKAGKLRAEVMSGPDAEEGERIAGTLTRDIGASGVLFVRISAPLKGAGGKYAIAETFQPATVIAAKIVEDDRRCQLSVGAGSVQGVHAGMAATIVSISGTILGQAVVDESFSQLSKVRMLGNCTAVGKDAAQIETP